MAVIRAGLNLDVVDMAIFDFIKQYAHSAKCMKLQTETGTYFWISHAKVIEELPILGITTGAGVIKRINKLIDAGLLNRHPNCDLMRKTFYCFGKNYDAICFTTLNESNEPTTNVNGTPNERLGVSPNDCLGNQSNNNQPTIVSNNADGGLFPGEPVVVRKRKEPETHEPRCHFAESKYNRYEDFAAQFTAPEFANIDIAYYHKAVADWSAADDKNKKNDWIATARNFMRSDMEKKKLHTIEQAGAGFDYESAKRYLEMGMD